MNKQVPSGTFFCFWFLVSGFYRPPGIFLRPCVEMHESQSALRLRKGSQKNTGKTV
jgi:hypothetical protein